MATDSESKRNYLCDKHLQESWTASNWIYWKSLGIPVCGATLLIFAFCLPNVMCQKELHSLDYLINTQLSQLPKQQKNIGAAADIVVDLIKSHSDHTAKEEHDVDETISETVGPDINWTNQNAWYPENVWVPRKTGKPLIISQRNKTSTKCFLPLPKYSRGRSLIPKKHQMPGSIWATYLHGKLG